MNQNKTNKLAQDLAFVPQAMCGFAGVGIGIVIASLVGII